MERDPHHLSQQRARGREVARAQRERGARLPAQRDRHEEGDAHRLRGRSCQARSHQLESREAQGAEDQQEIERGLDCGDRGGDLHRRSGVLVGAHPALDRQGDGQ
jgi:hypothetical protein